MTLSSFFINDRKVSHLEINGRTVILRHEPVSCDALCFTALEPGSTVKITKNGSAPNVNLQTSTDGNSWTPYAVNDVITLANVGDKVYFKAVGSNLSMGSGSTKYNKFVMSGKIAASGNVNSLLEEDELTARTMSLAGKNQAYSNLFNGCKSLTQAPVLPATTLAERCYNSMFKGCSSLTQAPVLPATTLADSCYMYMFSGCSSLTQAPELPATTLATYCYFFMFNECTSLTQAPELPSTTLAERCYSSMFNGCSSLTQAPELPVTTLANWCYSGMFSNCTSLTSAPALPATTLASSCYWGMFSGCSSLTQAPELHVTTLDLNCYNNMFAQCTSLTQAPELPATTLDLNCYNGMFQGCTSLTQAPELPATTLATSCYTSMFSGCTSLTQAPELPATTLSGNCYSNMFLNCSNLNTITLGYTGNFADAPNLAFNNWVDGVSSTGTFYYKGSDTTTGVSAIPRGWVVVAPLCFTALEANSTLHLDKVGTPGDISLETSVDGNTWSDYSWTDSTGDTLTLSNVGDKVYFRAKTENQTIGISSSNYYKFVMTGKISSSGNIQALLKVDCSRTDAPANCYNGMFSGCTSLTQAPELPATTLAKFCYLGMFSNCTSLTQAPVLPATTLAESCYLTMFLNCSNLNTITLGYTGNFSDAPSNAFNNWVNGVSSTGTFYYNGTDTTTGVSAIPSGWTVVKPSQEISALCFTALEPGSTVKITKNGSAPDVNLQTSTDGNSWTPYNVEDTITLANVGDKVYFKAVGSNSAMGTMWSDYNKFVMTGKIAASGNINSLLEEDELTARTMSLEGKDYCYFLMFYDCTSLTTAPELPATTLAESCYDSMFYGCTSLTQAPELPATTLAYSCYANMFSGCTSLTQAPALPATTLSNNCYYCMFYGCSSLTQAPELPATTLANSCYANMFSGCTSLTQAPALPATTLADSCYASMFDSCTSLTQAPELPATTLATYCYWGMFNGCTGLNSIKVGFNNWDPTNATDNWLPNNSGTFGCPQALIDNTTERTTSTVPSSWTMTAV